MTLQSYLTYIAEKAIPTTGSFGIARKDMPQIKGNVTKEFLQYLRNAGVRISNQRYTISTLKPTQKELDSEKVKKWAKIRLDSKYNFSDRPLIISKDKYILDGHHRWAGVKEVDPLLVIPVYEVNVSMMQLLKLAKDFDMVSFKQLHEAEERKNEEPSNVEKIKEKQEREKERSDRKNEDELARAREQDFQDKEKEIQKKLQDKRIEDRLKQSQKESLDVAFENYLLEYVEDGTPEAVKAYQKAVPGQNCDECEECDSEETEEK